MTDRKIIEDRRRYYATKLENEVRQIEVYKNRSQSTIDRLKNLENRNSDQVKNKITTLEQTIIGYDEEIITKTKAIELIRIGKKDNELEKQAKTSQKEHIKQRKTYEKKQKDITDEKYEQKKQFDKQSTIRYKQNREDRFLEKDMVKEYSRYMAKCETLPDYMRKKLQDMPNNKGYIFRGIWFLGEQPEEPGKPQLMFEKKGKDILLIHEYDKTEYRLYEKKGKNRQVLISTAPRKVLSIKNRVYTRR